MRLLDLAPDIQETILFEHPAITERRVRAIVRLVDWDRQRRSWMDSLGWSAKKG